MAINLPKAIVLSFSQMCRIRDAYADRHGTCTLCMCWDEDGIVWIVPHIELVDAVIESMERAGVTCELGDVDELDVAETVPLLELTCSGCDGALGTCLTDALAEEVGGYLRGD